MKRLLIFLLFGLSAWATNPALVGSGGSCAGHFTSTDDTCAYTVVNTGDAVVVDVLTYSGSAPSITLTSGKVSSFAPSGNCPAITSSVGKMHCLYIGVSTSSGSDTITCGKGGATFYCGIMVFTFSNSASPTEDKFINTATSVVTNLDSGTTGATTTAVEILVGCAWNVDGNRNFTAGTSVAWAQAQILQDASFGAAGYCEYFIATSTGTYHADIVQAASGNTNTLISTIIPGGGGGGAPVIQHNLMTLGVGVAKLEPDALMPLVGIGSVIASGLPAVSLDGTPNIARQKRAVDGSVDALAAHQLLVRNVNDDANFTAAKAFTLAYTQSASKFDLMGFPSPLVDWTQMVLRTDSTNAVVDWKRVAADLGALADVAVINNWMTLRKASSEQVKGFLVDFAHVVDVYNNNQ